MTSPPGARAESQQATAWASSIAWSRDSSRLAYSHSDASGDSVRVMSLADGATDCYPTDGMTMSELGLQRRRQCAGWRALDDDARPRWKRSAAPGIPAPNIKVVRRLRYKQDGVGWVHDRYRQIWALQLDRRDFVQITHSECDYSSPKWSNSGLRLAFVGMAREQNTPLGYGQIFHLRLSRWRAGAADTRLAGHDVQSSLGR